MKHYVRPTFLSWFWCRRRRRRRRGRSYRDERRAAVIVCQGVEVRALANGAFLVHFKAAVHREIV